MVYDFPPDSLHLFDLGCTKKILNFLVEKIMTKQNVERLSDMMFQLRSYVPQKMGRKPRKLYERKHFKGTEYRLFGLYIGIVALKNKMPNNLFYEHYLCYAIAYRLLLMHNNFIVPEGHIQMARNLLKIFVQNFQKFYGETSLCYNIHMLLHICEFVERFGSLDSFSSYRYENMYQKIKKKLRRGTQMLQQIYNRWLEFRGEINDSKFDKTIYSSREPDNCVTLDSGKIVLILKRRFCNGEFVYHGKEFMNLSNYFEEPIESSVLGIHEVKLDDLCDFEYQFKEGEIQFKNVLFPTFTENKAVVLPILHYL